LTLVLFIFRTNRSLLLLSVLPFVLLSQLSAQHIECEDHEKATLKICHIRESPITVSIVKVISPRLKPINVLDLDENIQTYFLPVNISEAFPNLLEMTAKWCSIKSISRENFQGLVQLKKLSLYRNQLTLIHSDTFVGLRSLESVNLGSLV
jgi:Leucine-rich repeat (LRR) protein